MVRQGDILVSTANSKELVGKAALVRTLPMRATFGAFVTVLRPRTGTCPEFLWRYLQSPAARRFHFLTSSNTTGISNLRVSDLLAAPMPHVPLPEQRRIAALLDEQMAIVERARVAARTAREAAASMEHAHLRQVFHGICPLAADASARPAPPGWRWRILTDLARLETGHTPSRSRPDWWGGPIPWLALPDIRRLDGRTAERTLESTNAEGIANSAARILPAGTVVLSRTASIGFVTVLGREMATSQDFVNWVCGPELEPWFLAHLLRASRQFLLFVGSGAVHKTVYFPTVEAFRVCVPDVEVQRRIVTLLGERLAQTARVTASLDAELERLDALPSSLLRLAFSEGA